MDRSTDTTSATTSEPSDRSDGPAAPLDAGLLRLGHLNNVEFTRELVRWAGPGAGLDERDGLLLAASSSPFPVVANAMFRVSPGLPAAEAMDRADAFFGARDRGYTVMVQDRDGCDDDLAAEAIDRGFVEVTGSPEMVCRAPVAERAVPAGIEVRWVTDEAGVADMVAVNAAAYQSLGMPAGVIEEMVVHLDRVLEPHWHTVVAYDGGRPVATAQTLLSHGIAGVYFVGVLEAARGRGLADLVTRLVTNRGFEAGARLQTLQASPMGEPVYLRMGYEEVYRYRGLTRFGPA